MTSAKQQMSQRMMRNTAEGRPFAQEFQDLFGALVTTLDLRSHRIRLHKRSHTFFTRDAVEKLSSLKLTSTNRRVDPKDPSRIYTTTTTTTFAMNAQCAKSHCQKFLDAKYLESPEGKTTFKNDGDVWQLTPKGIKIVQAFCTRLGINHRLLWDLIDSVKDCPELFILERDATTDAVVTDRATTEIIFRRFIGLKTSDLDDQGSNSDNDSTYGETRSLPSVKMQKERQMTNGIMTTQEVFTGRAALDCLMNGTTAVEYKEAYAIAQAFLAFKLIQPCTSESRDRSQFIPTKTTTYALTEEGRRFVTAPPTRALLDEIAAKTGNRSSNTARLLRIINYPALRSLFRQYLRDTHCEENLMFYMEVTQLLNRYEKEQKQEKPSLSATRDMITTAYGLYNTYLAPSSACELNIEHVLRNSIANKMSEIVHKDDDRIADFFTNIVFLLRQAQTAMLKLMASDSIPKFMKSERYESQLSEKHLLAILNGDDEEQNPIVRSGSTSSTSGPRSASLSSTDSTLRNGVGMERDIAHTTAAFVGLSAA